MDLNSYINLINEQKDSFLLTSIFIFLSLAVLETQWTGYTEKLPRVTRWPNHFLLALLNALVFRFLLPSFGIWVSMEAFGRGFGLLNQVPVPMALGVVLTIIFLDWMTYYWHRANHAFAWLWKLHRVHHTDPEVDVTTGFRFHPVELLLTAAFKGIFIAVLGAPVYGVFIYEVLSGISLIFNHANIQLPPKVEKVLRWVFLTPYMHRTHHSPNSWEMNSDYGFLFSIWDRMFGTYQNPEKTQAGSWGLNVFHGVRFLNLKALILQPFLDPQGHFKLKNFFTLK